MTMKPLEQTGRNQFCIVLVLDNEVELNGLYSFLEDHLPVFFEDWTCGEIHRKGHNFFELEVYLLLQLTEKSVAGSPT